MRSRYLLFLVIAATVRGTRSQPDPVEKATDNFLKGLRFDQFDLNLCEALYAASPTTNVAVSPISVRIALAMLYEAASGHTAYELQTTLNLPTSKRDTRMKFGSIVQSLNDSGNDTELKLASRVFVKPGLNTSHGYMRVLEKYYAATMNIVDFTKPREAAKLINDWVCEATNGKIKSMMNPNDPQIPNLMMVISNALFFKGLWEQPFDPQATMDGLFHTRGGKTVTVPLMQNRAKYHFAENVESGYNLIRLPYRGSKYALYIVLPNERFGIDNVLPKLTPDGIRETMKTMTLQTVSLYLPKFNFQIGFDLEPILISLGIKKIFNSGEAEFPMISDQVFVSRILHKAGLEINELGSTFYSVTRKFIVHGTVPKEIDMTDRWSQDQQVMRVDHPFMFFIKDDSAETIVFAAKVENPLMEKNKVESTTVRPINQTDLVSRLGQSNNNQAPTSRPVISRPKAPPRYVIKKIVKKDRSRRTFGPWQDPYRSFYGPQNQFANFPHFPSIPSFQHPQQNHFFGGFQGQQESPRFLQRQPSRRVNPQKLSPTSLPLRTTTPSTTTFNYEENINKVFGTPPPVTALPAANTTNIQDTVNNLYYNLNQG